MDEINKLIKVLVVEDNLGDAKLAEKYLSSQGQQLKSYTFETLVAKDMAATLGNDPDSFDMILLDLNLPDSTGIQTLKKIKETFSDIPVVILSGMSDEKLAFEALESGAQDYLLKDQLNDYILKKTIIHAIVRYKLEQKLQISLQKQIEDLRDLLPICMRCNKIRDDNGYWLNVTEYINLSFLMVSARSVLINIWMSLKYEHRLISKF